MKRHTCVLILQSHFGLNHIHKRDQIFTSSEYLEIIEKKENWPTSDGLTSTRPIHEIPSTTPFFDNKKRPNECLLYLAHSEYNKSTQHENRMKKKGHPVENNERVVRTIAALSRSRLLEDGLFV